MLDPERCKPKTRFSSPGDKNSPPPASPLKVQGALPHDGQHHPPELTAQSLHPLHSTTLLDVPMTGLRLLGSLPLPRHVSGQNEDSLLPHTLPSPAVVQPPRERSVPRSRDQPVARWGVEMGPAY